MLKLCYSTAKTAVPLVSQDAMKELENITRVDPRASFDAVEPVYHSKKIDDFKRIPRNSKDERLAGEVLTK